MLKMLKSKQPGFIAPMALIAAVFLFILGLGILSLGMNRRALSIRSNNQLAARCAADYGLTKAIYEMNKRLWTNAALPSESSVPLPGGSSYSYTVSYDATKTPPYSVVVTGKSAMVTKTVRCDLRLKGIFEYAILTKNTLDIGSCSTVTCNGCGSVPLKIGTTNNPTASVILKPGSDIDGDILLGQDGSPSLIVGSGATYDHAYAVATDFDLPEPSLPKNPDYATYATNHGTINLTKDIHVSTGAYIYNKIDMQAGGSLFIDGPGNVSIWIKSDIEVGTNAEIKIDPNASLTIYLSGAFNGHNGCVFNNGGDPSKLTIVALSSNPITITFKNGAAFNGTIYAPYSNVTLNNSVLINGSVIANNYFQDNDAIFTYDASLRTASLDDLYVRFVPIHWREL